MYGEQVSVTNHHHPFRLPQMASQWNDDDAVSWHFSPPSPTQMVVVATDKLTLFQVPTPVSLGRPTLDGILAYIDQLPHDPATCASFVFSWPAARIHELLNGGINDAVESRRISKFDYDFYTEIASFNTMGDSQLYRTVQTRLHGALLNVFQNRAEDAEDHDLRFRLCSVWAVINDKFPVPGRLQVTGDITFTEVDPARRVLPSLICEIC